MNAREAIYDTLDRFSGSDERPRQEHVYNRAFNDAMVGEGDFWPTDNDWRKGKPVYDGEQYLEVFRAVQIAMQIQGSAAERWQVVERRLRPLIDDYADEVARLP